MRRQSRARRGRYGRHGRRLAALGGAHADAEHLELRVQRLCAEIRVAPADHRGRGRGAPGPTDTDAVTDTVTETASDTVSDTASDTASTGVGGMAEPDAGLGRVRSAWARALEVLRRQRLTVAAAAGRRAVFGVGLVALLVVALTGWRVLQDRPRTAPVARPVEVGGPVLGSTPAASRGASGTAGPSAAVVVVDVVGKVHRPGLVRLPVGSRVADAIGAAGGALPHTDLTSLNLARVLVDGEQIAVGVPGAGGAGGSAPPVGGATGRVNLNLATLEQLEQLPGVGPVLAQRILDWRTQHGRFTTVEQLRDVSGIGPATFARLKDLVTV